MVSWLRKQLEKGRFGASVPAIGEEIYVDTALHLHRGRDDVLGGRAQVVAVHRGYRGMDGIWVEVAEHPGDLHNWDELGPRQAALRRGVCQQRGPPLPPVPPGVNEN